MPSVLSGNLGLGFIFQGCGTATGGFWGLRIYWNLWECVVPSAPCKFHIDPHSELITIPGAFLLGLNGEVNSLPEAQPSYRSQPWVDAGISRGYQTADSHPQWSGARRARSISHLERVVRIGWQSLLERSIEYCTWQLTPQPILPLQYSRRIWLTNRLLFHPLQIYRDYTQYKEHPRRGEFHGMQKSPRQVATSTHQTLVGLVADYQGSQLFLLTGQILRPKPFSELPRQRQAVVLLSMRLKLNKLIRDCYWLKWIEIATIFVAAGINVAKYSIWLRLLQEVRQWCMNCMFGLNPWINCQKLFVFIYPQSP